MRKALIRSGDGRRQVRTLQPSQGWLLDRLMHPPSGEHRKSKSDQDEQVRRRRYREPLEGGGEGEQDQWVDQIERVRSFAEVGDDARLDVDVANAPDNQGGRRA